MTNTPKLNQSTTSYQPVRNREVVLIVAHGDGWIEAYADKHIDVRIEIAPYMTTPEGERLSEEYVGLMLPKRYQEMYWPIRRRAAGQVRKVLPSDIELRDWELGLLKAIDSAGDILRGDSRQERKIWML
jgi:hypothetical protein